MATGKDRKASRVTLTKAERDAVVRAVQHLPKEWRNAKVVKLLARSVRDPDLARELRTRPRDYFDKCGVPIPPGYDLEIHYATPRHFQVVLPSSGLAQQTGRLDITDKDLVKQVEAASWVDDDNWIGDGRDPRAVTDKAADDPGGWSDNVNDDPSKPRGDWGRDPRANNDDPP
jgi:hypothetical protein